ncbi:MAG: hypothetical protein F7C07_05330 [Desulfurococcales archaeon]|nr:hypothetical protein [Desulfurococcales archaeon]
MTLKHGFGRGLSEVLGGLLVALAMVGLAVSLYAITSQLTSKAITVASDASLRLEEATTPPQLVLRLYPNGSLALQVFSIREVVIEKVLVAYGNGSFVELEGSLVKGSWGVIISRNYNCEPVRVAVLTSRGNVFYYNPLSDPGARNPSVLPGGFVDCSLFLGGSSGAARVYSGGGEIVVELIDAGATSASVQSSYNLGYVDSLKLNGWISGRCRVLAYRGSTYFGSTTNETWLTLGSMIVGGREVNVTLGLLCTKRFSALYLVFRYDEGSMVINGSASIVYSAETYARHVPSGGYNDTVLPMLYSPLGDFRGSSTLRYKYGSIGNYIESWGAATARFSTTGPVVVLVNTMGVELWIDARLDISVEAAQLLATTTIRQHLGISSPATVTRECPTVAAAEDVTEAVFRAPWTSVKPGIEILHPSGSIYRELGCGETIRVEAPAQAVLEAVLPAPREAPLISSMNVTQTSWVSEGGWYVKNYTIESRKTPIPAPWRTPYMIVFTHEGSLMLTAQNGWMNATVWQEGSVIAARTSLLAGININVTPPDSIVAVYHSTGPKPYFSVSIAEPSTAKTPEEPQTYALIIIASGWRETEIIAWSS